MADDNLEELISKLDSGSTSNNDKPSFGSRGVSEGANAVDRRNLSKDVSFGSESIIYNITQKNFQIKNGRK